MRQVIAAAAVLVCVQMACADTVLLNNGDKITGTILELNGTAAVVQTPYAGKVTIERGAIQTMQSEKAVAVTAAGGEKQQLYLSPTADGKGTQQTAAYVPPAPPKPARYTSYLNLGPDWKNQLSIGVSNTAGNDQTTTFVGNLSFNYLHKPDEFNLKFDGVYGVSNGAQSAGLFAQSAIYRHDVQPRLYWYISEDVRHDVMKGIALQAVGTTGLGYKLVDEEALKIDVRGGPGVTYTKLFDGNTDVAPAAEAGLRLQYVFNERVSLIHEDTYVTSLLDLEQWRIHSETALNVKLDLERGLGLKFGFNDDYENRPATGRKNNDTRLMLSLTLDF